MERASGGRFEGGIARRGAGARPLGPSRRAAAGFWRRRGRADEWQDGAQGAPHPVGREWARVQAAFPRQAPVRDDGAGQPKLSVGQEHQPGPAVGLLRVADARRRPGEDLFAEAEGVFLVKPPDIGPPKQRQVEGAPVGTLPPQPELLRLTRLARQALHLDAHQGAPDDRLGAARALGGVILRDGVEVGPGAHTHAAVLLLSSSVVCSAVGGGQVAGSAQENVRPWRRGRPVVAAAAGSGSA